ncbi:MAG TPA: HD domain-containing protein [Ktedonobacteraceae bacterium]|jgi:HD superfamily phosphohydrolase|nr:HD domain-containing protein [Ktedonobacteraceae bacterium]
MKMPAERAKTSRSRRQIQPPLQRGEETQVQAEMLHNWRDAGGYPLLPDEQSVSTVRDSLYDLIPLGEREEKLIGTRAFLRLQQIKQLGFVYRIWPGATHTRFEHSLGCYHLTVRALRSLLQQGAAGGLYGVTTSSIQTLVVAALLHDIGHYPYSHTIEELGAPIIHHEQVGRAIIENSEIATILERDYRLSPGRVADMIDPPKQRALHPDDELLRHLLSGALDVDKLDYLPRDARACNVPYGGVDVSRLLGALRVQDVNGLKRMVVTHKGISPLHSLLHARQEMFDNIYWHHTSRAMQAMLVRAVHDALSSEALHAEQLTDLDDASLLHLLSGDTMPASVRALSLDLTLRRPYKVALDVSRQAGRLFNRLDALFWDAARRRRIEQSLAAELAATLETEIADYELLFDIPRPEKWEMDVWISFAHPPVGMEPLMTWVEVTGLQSDDLARYEQHQRRIRVLVPERLRALFQARRDDVLLPAIERLI